MIVFIMAHTVILTVMTLVNCCTANKATYKMNKVITYRTSEKPTLKPVTLPGVLGDRFDDDPEDLSDDHDDIDGLDDIKTLS